MWLVYIYIYSIVILYGLNSTRLGCKRINVSLSQDLTTSEKVLFGGAGRGAASDTGTGL
jgi:hypothetical protein